VKKVLYLKLSAYEAYKLTQDRKKMEEIEKKVEDKLKKLGNIIDDVLLMLEQEAIGAGKDPFTEKRITTLIDIYAEEFDEILRKHRVGMGSEILKLMRSLLDDLEKLTNSEGVE
jgi:predicted restriction endonuclease